MSNAHGSFIWYELLTKDAAAAKAFYDSVVGWDIDGQAPPGPKDYRMIKTHDGHVGGVMQLDEAMLAGGAKPVWLGYFGVDDVDATVAAMTADGAQVHLPAFDIPGVGRLAMVADPQGAVFYVMRGASPEASNAYQRMGLQHVSWNELMTSDDAAALAFYEKHLGITKVGSMPMGAMGEYSFIANGDSKGEAVGAMMRAQPGTPIGWGFYFRVPEIQAAKAAVEAGGGTVISGPMQVPGGEWAMNCTDFEGTLFGLVSPGNSEA